MGGDDVTVPGPSSEERALQREQVESLRFQRSVLEEMQRERELLSPFLFEEAGIQPILDEEGNITGFERVDDPTQALRAEIEEGFLQRTLAAQRGELPIDPVLLRELGKQELTLNERLRKQLGPGFETSSPGIEALGEFGERRAGLLSSASRGDLTLAEQLGISRQSSNEQLTTDFINRLLGISGADQPIASGFGSLAGGFGSAVSPLIQQRQFQTAANLQSQATRSSLFGDIFQAIGQVGGSFFGRPQ